MSDVAWGRLPVLLSGLIAGTTGYFIFGLTGFLIAFFGTILVVPWGLAVYSEHVARLSTLEDRIDELESELDRLADDGEPRDN